jgi:hypothetical protein
MALPKERRAALIAVAVTGKINVQGSRKDFSYVPFWA